MKKRYRGILIILAITLLALSGTLVAFCMDDSMVVINRSDQTLTESDVVQGSGNIEIIVEESGTEADESTGESNIIETVESTEETEKVTELKDTEIEYSEIEHTEIEHSDAEVSELEPSKSESGIEELSYIELYGLEEVDKPERRNEEQVLLKLEELAQKYDLVRQVYENAGAYSNEMLDHLANNPEMAAYVLGSLESDGSVTGGYTEEELSAEYPLLLQFDPRWGYYEYGGKEMGISGCGPTSLAMAILYLTDYEHVTPDKIVAYSLENGYYVKDVGTAWKLIDVFPTLYGLTVEHPGLSESSMKAKLDEGKVLLCSMKKGVFTAAGHFIVVYGYDETGFKVNDPKCVARSNRTWEFSEFGNQLKRIWAIGQDNEVTFEEEILQSIENSAEKTP